MRNASFLVALMLVAANLRPSITGVGPLLPDIQQSLALSATAAGLLGSLPLLMFGTFAPVARLGERVGTERLLLMGLVALLAGVLLRSAGGVAALYSGTALLAGAIAMTNVLVPVLVKAHYPDRLPTLTTAYATVMGVFASLSSGVVVPLAEVLPGGWRGALASSAPLTLLAILLWLPQLKAATARAPAAREAAVPAAAPAPAPAPATSVRALWRHPLAWQVAGYMGFQSAMFYVAISWYPAYLVENGFTPTAAGWLMTLYQVAALLAGLAIPPLVRRLSDQSLLATGLAVTGIVATLGLWLAPGAAVLWFVLLGIGGGPSLILALSFMGLRAVSARTAAALSLMAQSVGYVIAMFGPLLFGVIQDRSGGWSAALAAVMLMGVAKAICGFGAGRRDVIP